MTKREDSGFSLKPRTIRDILLDEGLTKAEWLNQKPTMKSASSHSRPAKRIIGDNAGRLEKDIEKEIAIFLRSMNWAVWKIKVKGEIQSIGGGQAILKKSENSGFPDILCCASSGINPTGIFLSIEVKRPGGSQSADQQSMQEYIESHRGIYILATSVAEVKLALYNLNLYPFKS
jgi:hypothetical protein